MRIGDRADAGRRLAGRLMQPRGEPVAVPGLPRGGAPAAPPAADPPAQGEETGEEVEATAGVIRLPGYLTVPAGAPGIVVFVHGSGSSRYSPRNRHVARVLNQAGLGTLLFDLLTPEEEAARANVFGIGLLAGWLAEVTRWLRAQPAARQTAVGSRPRPSPCCPARRP